MTSSSDGTGDQPAVVRVARLEGPRVVLRPYHEGFSEEELRRLYRWACDERLLELSGGRPLDVSFGRFRELFLAQLPRHNTRHEHLFAVLDERGRLIGRSGLFHIDRAAGRAELGIVIGARDRWDLGYGRETVRLLRRWGTRSLGLQRIVLYTFPDNVRAQRSFQAAGFRPAGMMKRFSLERGTHRELEMVFEAGSASAGTEG